MVIHHLTQKINNVMMVRLIKFLSIAVLFFQLPISTQADSGDSIPLVRSKFGLFSDFNYNIHTANFHQLPDVVNCCPDFTNGLGQGFTAGLSYELPFKNNLSVIGRAIYSAMNGEMTDDEAKQAMINGAITDGVVTHHLLTKVGIIGLEFLARYDFYHGLSVLGGFNYSYLFSGKYEQYEALKTPAGGLFDNGSNQRFNTSGNISGLAYFNSNLLLGASYDYSFDDKQQFVISPEVLFSFNFTPIVPTKIWNIHSIRAGIALKFAPIFPPKAKELPKAIEPPMPPPPVAETKDTVRPAIAKYVNLDYALFVGKKKEESKSISSEEFLSSRFSPLLNYVFFAHNSPKLDSRYNQISREESQKYTIDTCSDKSELETYYDILNIIGKRMKDNPDAKITITACNSNVEEEENNLELSQKRADVISNYLSNTWEIDPYRILINTRNLPEKASSYNLPEGIEENRRVEISSDNMEILAPLIINDTIADVKQTELRIYPETNVLKINNGKLVVESNGIKYKEINFNDQIPDYFVFGLKSLNDNVLRKSNELTCYLIIHDLDGAVHTSPKISVPIECLRLSEKKARQIADKKIHRFSLMLYEYDSYAISDRNMVAIDRIRKILDSKASITVEGYTDLIGNEDYNQKLSEKRAKAVADALNFDKVNYQGYGETKILYDNNLPEGRFYCRTVKVIVEKKR